MARSGLSSRGSSGASAGARGGRAAAAAPSAGASSSLASATRLAAALLVALVAMAATAASAAPAAAATPAAASGGGGGWAAYSAQARDVVLGNGVSLGDTVGKLMDYQFATPVAQVQASNVYTAGNARYRRAVADMMAARPVKIVAVGGTATNGSDASDPGRNDYFALYINALARAFPGSNITPVRATVGIAPSVVLAECIDRFVPDDADVVLLQMVTNDAAVMEDSIVDAHNAKAYELVMRRVLSRGKQPALILTQTLAPGMGNGKRPFYLTPEAPQYAALASYYGTPVVSLRNAVWPSGSPNAAGLVVAPGVSQEDGATPLDAAHRTLADTLVYLTQRTAQDLTLLPYGDYDRASAAADVPEATVYGDVRWHPDAVVQNGTCMWIKNVTGGSRRCPQRMEQVCGFDYTGPQQFARWYDQYADLGPAKPSKAAVIGGVVGGVVGGLLLLTGLLAWCVVSKRRQAKKNATAAEARIAARKLGGGSAADAAAAGGGSSAVSLTATSSANGSPVAAPAGSSKAAAAAADAAEAGTAKKP